MKYYINTYYPYTSLVPTDIYPVQYGEEQCRPDHDFGPCVRSNYLLHYIYEGKGIFRIENKEYHLHSGQMFLISPNQLAYYKADSNEPWLYRWIEFNGSITEKILASSDFINRSVIDDNSDFSIGKAVSDIVLSGDMPFEILMQKLWNLIFSMTNGTYTNTPSQAEEYIKKAEMFIKTNIHKKVSVNDVADFIGIDRSYLSRLFKEYKNISPQQYIINLKMNTAAQYLKNTNINITEVSQSVGYFDTHVFNKAFKKHFSCSPSFWRQKADWEKSIL